MYHPLHVILCLRLEETGVCAVFLQQLLVRPFLDDAAVVENIDIISQFHRRKAVADQDGAFPLDQLPELAEKLCLCQRV